MRATDPDVQPTLGEGPLSLCHLVRTPFTPSVRLALLTRLRTVQGRFGVSFTFESRADFGVEIELVGIKCKEKFQGCVSGHPVHKVWHSLAAAV